MLHDRLTHSSLLRTHSFKRNPCLGADDPRPRSAHGRTDGDLLIKSRGARRSGVVTASSPDSQVTMSPRQVPLMPGKSCLPKGRGLAGGGAGARGGNRDPRAQTLSSGPQAREQTLGQDGSPPTPARGRAPHGLRFSCFTVIIMFLWVLTVVQRVVPQEPGFATHPTGERTPGCPSTVWTPSNQKGERRGPGHEGMLIKKDKEGPRDSLSSFSSGQFST